MPPSDIDLARLLRAARRITHNHEAASTEAIALAGIQLAEEIVALLSEQPVRVVGSQSGWYTATSGPLR